MRSTVTNRFVFDVAPSGKKNYFVSQDCKIYLIGTKLDLIESGENVRKIDSSVAESYAEG